MATLASPSPGLQCLIEAKDLRERARERDPGACVKHGGRILFGVAFPESHQAKTLDTGPTSFLSKQQLTKVCQDSAGEMFRSPPSEAPSGPATGVKTLVQSVRRAVAHNQGYLVLPKPAPETSVV